MLLRSSKLKLISSCRFSNIAKRPSNFVGLLGIEEDGNSSYARGPTLAPKKIRECFQCDSSNSYSEMKINVAPYLHDYGDFIPKKEFQDVEEKIQRIHDDGRIPLVLGGDHSITAPVFNAIRKLHHNDSITIVHFDAHPDLYPLFQDNPHSHASPFARILERSHRNTQLIQIGIRTLNDIQCHQISKYNVEVIEAKDFPAKGKRVCSATLSGLKYFLLAGSDIKPTLMKHIKSKDSLVYISIDIDVMEPVSSFLC